MIKRKTAKAKQISNKSILLNIYDTKYQYQAMLSDCLINIISYMILYYINIFCVRVYKITKPRGKY